MLLDGDGAFLHFPYAGAALEQPHLDMEILQEVRSRWVGLTNKEIKKDAGYTTKGGVHVPGARSMPGMRRVRG